LKNKLFILFIFLGLFLADQSWAALTCSVANSCGNGTTVFKMYDMLGSHAELSDQTNYNNLVCCSGVTGLGNSCSGNYAVVLKLSNTTNAHVQKNNYADYTNNVCLSAPAGDTVTCNYSSDCPTLGANYTCLASISSDTNAHMGDCAAYLTKICCAVTPPALPTCAWQNGACNAGSCTKERQQICSPANCTGGECAAGATQCTKDDAACNPQVVQCNGSEMKVSDLKIYQAGDKYIAYDGLVPCGKCSLAGVNVNDKGEYTSGGEDRQMEIPCQLCHIFVMIKGIFDFLLLKIVPAVAILLLTVGGIIFLVSRGNPGTLAQARNILTSTMVGLVAIFASWLIINTVFTFIGLAEWTGNLKDGWFQINCSINLPS
jgi:hypothetical protein